MMDWTLQEATSDYERGLLSQVRIIAIAPDTWAIRLIATNTKDGEGWLLHSRTRERREMKSLKAAAEAVTNIGFNINQLIVA